MTVRHRVLAWLRGYHPRRTPTRPPQGFRKYPVAPRLGVYHVRRRLLERLGGGSIQSSGADRGSGI